MSFIYSGLRRVASHPHPTLAQAILPSEKFGKLPAYLKLSSQ
jgi:hypothetical protein